MPVLTKINTNSIAEDAITADKFAGDAYLSNTATQNISGTYSENRLYTSDAYTLSGNATINSHLTLSTIKSSGDVVLTAGGAYTITGTGVLSGGSLLAPARVDLTGMTGELGEAVTGTPAISGGFPAITGLGTVTSGTYNATIGSSATGFTGIKNFSYWYLNASFGFSSGTATWSNDAAWEEMQATRGYTSLDIGGAMSGPSSGVFTFPSTGYWLIIFSCSGRGNSAAPTVTAKIETTTNNSDFLDAARGYWFSTGDPTKEHTTVHFIFDVTSVSTHKCRFSTYQTAATYYECNGILQQNGATFIRLGDT